MPFHLLIVNFSFAKAAFMIAEPGTEVSEGNTVFYRNLKFNL